MRKCIKDGGADQCPGPTARCSVCSACSDTGCPSCTDCLDVGPGKKYSWLEYANLGHTEDGPAHYSRTCIDSNHDDGDGMVAANKPMVRPFADSGALASAYTAFDRSFFSEYKSSSQGSCFVGLDMGMDRSAVVTRIRFFPVNLVDVPGKVYRQPGGFAMQGGTFQVSDSLTGGMWTTVAQITAPHQGWNIILVEAKKQTAGRYVRYHGPEGSDCILSQLEFVGVVLSSANRCSPRITTRVPQPALSFKNNWAAPESVHVGDSVTYDYDAAVTPTITSIEPRFGSSLGGTHVTITGAGFPATTSAVGGVLVNGAPCELITVNTTQITCTTTKRKQFEPPTVRIWHKGSSGASYSGSTIHRQSMRLFRFLDRWSEAHTWLNDEMPGDMDSVLVPADQTLLMDMSVIPRLRIVLVQGLLVFDRIDAKFDAEFIIIQGGHFEIGTEDWPFEQDVTITLHGMRDKPALPIIGNKVIAVMSSPGHGAAAFGGGAWASLRDVGELDIHGKPRTHTWTKVSHPVQAGDATIKVVDSIDFKAGDMIVLSSPPETLEVAGVADGGKTILLMMAAQNSHASAVQYVDGEEVDLRCEVGLLSHNIVIQGDENTDLDQDGVQVIATQGSEIRIAHTEVRKCGAAGKAKHCIHIHQLGEVADGTSYVQGASVHHGWNRGIVLAKTNSFVLKGTVGFHVEGHMFHQSDFESEWNVYESNLGVYTRKTLGCGRTDCKPNTFSIFNPKNYWRYNVAADSMKYAFGFSMPCGTEATSYPMKEFFKNTAHHSGTGFKTSCSYTPTTAVYIHNNTFHSNWGTGAFHKAAGDLHHVHSRFALNRGTDINWARLLPSGADRADPQIRDSYFIGGRGAVAIEGPSSEYFLVSGASFSNYGTAPAIKGCRTCCGEKTWQGAYTYTYEKLKFFDSDVRIAWHCPFKQIYFDKDGSLTGHVNGSATAYKKFNDWTDATEGNPCTPGNETFSGGIVCDGSVRIRRLEFKDVNPDEINGLAVWLKKSGKKVVYSNSSSNFYAPAVEEMYGGVNYTLHSKTSTLFDGKCHSRSKTFHIKQSELNWDQRPPGHNRPRSYCWTHQGVCDSRKYPDSTKWSGACSSVFRCDDYNELSKCVSSSSWCVPFGADSLFRMTTATDSNISTIDQVHNNRKGKRLHAGGCGSRRTGSQNGGGLHFNACAADAKYSSSSADPQNVDAESFRFWEVQRKSCRQYNPPVFDTSLIGTVYLSFLFITLRSSRV